MNSELNVLVAQKVMGWTLLPKGDLREGCWLDEHNKKLYLVLADFSGDIAQAWRVVEKMRELGWDTTINCHQTARGNSQYLVEMEPLSRDDFHKAVSKSAPEA